MTPQVVEAYIGLGSNLEDPVRQIESALVELGQMPFSQLLARSSLVFSKPLGAKSQPDYVNAVAKIETALNPDQLLARLQRIEHEHGRVRSERWGPRTLDLDLLLYGDQRIQQPHLTVPHPGMAQRAFVLVPLLEIEPRLQIPGLGSLSTLLRQLPKDALTMNTISTLNKMKAEQRKIAVITAYDAGFARVAEAAGVDAVLVGDSLGMVVQGHGTTLPVTMDNMVYHTSMVSRACQRAMVIADMPFMSHPSHEQALLNAGRLMKEGGAHMVKLEGGQAQAETVRHLTERSVPVCAHLGLLPQAIHQLGGYRVQGRDKASAHRILNDARVMQDAGAQMLVLECIPSLLACEITAALNIPVIGIGAGPDCDGQVLVMHDVLGITEETPSFARNFMVGAGSIHGAVQAYVQAVRSGAFPTAEQSFE